MLKKYVYFVTMLPYEKKITKSFSNIFIMSPFLLKNVTK